VAVIGLVIGGAFGLRGGSLPGRGPTAPPSADPSSPPDTTVIDPEDPALAAMFDRLRTEVSAVRGLPWKSEVPIRLVSRDELAQEIRALTEKDLRENAEELEFAALSLKLLGLVPDDLDYDEALANLVAGGALGYYDDEAGEMVVASGTGPLDVFARSTLAHELTHALTDQYFDFSARVEALDEAEADEAVLALVALVEGDAEVTRKAWEERHLSADERRSLARGDPEFDPSALAAAPPYMTNSLLFPYRFGVSFVERLIEVDGFASVDAAYRQPPTTSSEIINPSRYGFVSEIASPPIQPAAPGCRQLDEGNLGEFDTGEILSQHLRPAVARAAAQGWTADRFVLLRCGTRDAFVAHWVMADADEAAELAAALQRWGPQWSGVPAGGAIGGPFGGPVGSGRVLSGGSEVQLFLADDGPTADLVTRMQAPGVSAP